MTDLITDAQWATYRDLINSAGQTFNTEPVIWRRKIQNMDYHGEGMAKVYNDITLLGLIQYNVLRVWPIQILTESGKMDNENCLLILNKDYLRGLGYLNANDYFTFDGGFDRFVIRGQTYQVRGDTEAAQEHNDPLLYYIILIREQLSTPGPVQNILTPGP